VTSIAVPQNLADATVRLRKLAERDAPAYAAGRGVASAAVSLALDWAFNGLGLLRVELATTVENLSSQAVARRHWFTQEALQRARDVERGKRVDVIQFGLLREEHRGAGAV
jgi:RimJ/RimL family protein N-acetyltransferase